MAYFNLLLGNGEALVEDLQYRSGGGPKSEPYSFDEALERLGPMLKAAADEVMSLPSDACPDNRAVLHLTLHPAYLAKSYFPGSLLKLVNVDVVGNRSTKVIPDKLPNKRTPVEMDSVVLYAFGDRGDIQNWQSTMHSWDSMQSGGYDEIKHIEAVDAPIPLSKVSGILPDADDILMEIILHPAKSNSEESLTLEFKKYLESLDLTKHTDKSFSVNGLSFIGVRAPYDRVEEIAMFAGVRTIRTMPQIRGLHPVAGIRSVIETAPPIPEGSAVSNNIRIAVFDGGLPTGHVLSQWVKCRNTTGIHPTDGKILEHGTAVTSAALFGPIVPGEQIQRPFANVDHFCIIDENSQLVEKHPYNILSRICDVLDASEFQYNFINFSVAPEQQVEDDDIDTWTAVIDCYLSKSDCLATIAAGNNGEYDSLSMQNRVMIPSDSVNGMSIGACDSMTNDWKRAPYSAVGPGREPGVIKPDMVFFGGTQSTPFWAFDTGPDARLYSQQGTSFSAPSVLRIAAGIKAGLDTQVSAQTIRALLVHTAQRGDEDVKEVGWGRCAQKLEDILYCNDNEARVVYQGSIAPSKYIRAEIPTPSSAMNGIVEITATVCFRTLTDPHHPASYTQTSLDILFRPHFERFGREGGNHPQSDTFFGKAKLGATETELRKLDMKWESCRHAVKRKRGESLYKPVFDIHCNSRQESHDFRPDMEIPYALVVTVKAAKVPDLYNRIIQKYAGTLEPMKIALEVPIQRDFELTSINE